VAAVISRSAETVAVWLWNGGGNPAGLAAGLQDQPHQQRTHQRQREHRQGIDHQGKDAPALVGSPLQAMQQQPAQHHRRTGQGQIHRPIGPLLPEGRHLHRSFLQWGIDGDRLKRRRFFNHQLQRNLQGQGVAKGEPATLPGQHHDQAAHHGGGQQPQRGHRQAEGLRPSSPKRS